MENFHRFNFKDSGVDYDGSIEKSVMILEHSLNQLNKIPEITRSEFNYEMDEIIAESKNIIKNQKQTTKLNDSENCVKTVVAILKWCANLKKQFNQKNTNYDDIFTTYFRNYKSTRISIINFSISLPLVKLRNTSIDYLLNIDFKFYEGNQLDMIGYINNNTINPILPETEISNFCKTYKEEFIHLLKSEIVPYINEAMKIYKSTHIGFLDAAVLIYLRECKSEELISKYLGIDERFITEYRNRALSEESKAIKDLNKSKNTIEFLYDFKTKNPH